MLRAKSELLTLRYFKSVINRKQGYRTKLNMQILFVLLICNARYKFVLHQNLFCHLVIIAVTSKLNIANLLCWVTHLCTLGMRLFHDVLEPPGIYGARMTLGNNMDSNVSLVQWAGQCTGSSRTDSSG